ncbi:MAG: hypothetical protein RJA57_2028 [Bacteroidota bacterium]|jgi:NADH-quinone oxidoreductase subunit N
MMLTEFLQLMKAELSLTVLIFFFLFIKIGRGMRNEILLPLAQTLLLLNFIAGFFFNLEGQLFGTMYLTTPLIVLQKNLLNLGVYLLSLVCSGWLRRTPHLPEFLLLMLSALLGMFLLLSAGNLLLFYLALELASIPVAAMANFDLDRKRASEGAMKLILSSAFSSGILLFGISLLYGATGTIDLAVLAGQWDGSPLHVLAFLFLFAAFAFKLSIVPFHFWTADVYEGSPVAVTSFLSVISKGAIAFAFLSFLYRVFPSAATLWYLVLVLTAVCTLVIGNLFAMRQSNMKRFLAFSSIAQVGFILVAISGQTTEGTRSVVYFLLVYLFSNLAAFGVVDAIAQQTGREKISDYRGLYATNPFLSWVLTLSLFSLAGIPPTAGFFGKLFLLTAGSVKGNFPFILFAALNMVLSLYYYLRVVRSVFMEKNEDPIEPVKLSSPVRLGLLVCCTGILAGGLLGWLYDYIISITG